MIASFTKNTVEVCVKYRCDCGHKFTRKNSDWFTVSPFSTKTPTQCRKDIIERQLKRMRICPMCGGECHPV